MSLALNYKFHTQSDQKLPPGTNRCQCASCGAYFGGVNGFERHRIGPAADRRCLPLGAVRDKQNRSLLRLTEQGYWVRIDRPVHLRQTQEAA